jgi:hypothetical protein
VRNASPNLVPSRINAGPQTRAGNNLERPVDATDATVPVPKALSPMAMTQRPMGGAPQMPRRGRWLG